MSGKKSGSMVKMAESGGRRVTMDDVLEKDAAGEVSTPFTEIDTLESITLGFRQVLFTLKNKDGEGLEVMSTGGFGGTSLILEWVEGKGKKRTTRQAMIDSVELGIRWVETFADGKALREATGR